MAQVPGAMHLRATGAATSRCRSASRRALVPRSGGQPGAAASDTSHRVAWTREEVVEGTR
ncbi:hypothetical protein BE17_25925 [Sorangium cellulosum]|uniref:Uncharacterized protein n=1 Tax=Sorangium cellulosum TaxID=56 RepID=A0A150RM73_SORCE|nr:hypothetical protein BE17_25925 [Sorangium cellulosum]